MVGRRLRSSWARFHAEEDGVSLVELMFAILLLAVAILALASTAILGLTNLRSARDRDEATNAASAAIEAVRTGQYDQIFMDPSDPAVAALGGCHEGEPVASNAVVSPIQVNSTNDQVRLRTYVTWFQSVDDADCVGANDDERLAKRVTVVAEWDDGEIVRQVREDTIVAPAGRGLPVPDFDLSPVQSALNFDPSEVAAGATKCRRHQLRNLGAEDSYDWDLTNVTPSTGPPFKATPTSYRTANGKWEVTAYFQTPAATPVSTPDPSRPDTEQMIDLDANARPETSFRVKEGEIANIWFCWKPAASVSSGEVFDAVLTVHSRFDGNRVETIKHTVGVGTVATRFFLYDSNDGVVHARPGRTTGGTFTPDPYTMGPQDGLIGSTDNLGTTLRDWDTNIDTGGLPGIRLPRGTANLAAQWHEQFGSARVVKRNATLTLYVASSQALGAGAPAGQTLRLGVTFERLRSNERTVDATLVTVSPVNVPLATTGWTKLELPIDLGADRSFASGQFLRLRVSCLSTSDADCHLAYDNTTYDSNLAVNLQ